ncbi:hypothetical protein FHS07_002945 [Microbacterium proteolyticum]|uniref:Uncharacterized protein n=1 Tax=Microbacterium proteolyticum TaxID=1572644 RepID=A0A7W5CKB4_9MICO|nr:hypothetical protein [Microbacterium proteolyticum]MBB3159227.1 hypothetical protein [Microbacterium proteolyticum]
MPVRRLLNKDLLEGWLTKFRDLGYLTGSEIRLLEQEDETDPDSGLIVVDLSGAKTVTYLQPITGGDGAWKATMEARDATIELDTVELVNLGNELIVLAALVSFLEVKSKALLAGD